MPRQFVLNGETLVEVRGGIEVITKQEVAYKDLDFMGYKGYRVGDDGSVWSRRRGGGWSDWRQLTPLRLNQKKQRCPEVGLFGTDGKCKRLVISRLVLAAFVGPCPDRMEACHNDGNAKNNRLENLRWDTHINNERDKLSHGTLFRGEQVGNAKLTGDQVANMKYLRLRKGWTLDSLAAKYKVKKSTVWQIVKEKWWRHIPCPDNLS